jgi:hypothetical protein
MVSVIRGVESDRKKKEKLRWMDCSEMNSSFVKRTASVTRGVELVETEKFSQAQCEELRRTQKIFTRITDIILIGISSGK